MTDTDCPHCGRTLPPAMCVTPLDHSACINIEPCPFQPTQQGQAWPERDDRETEEVEA
jgi:hypothetical protein